VRSATFPVTMVTKACHFQIYAKLVKTEAEDMYSANSSQPRLIS
jgi:hypothetical protein